MSPYVYLAGTLLFTAYGQLIVKARSGVRTSAEASNAFLYLLKMMLDPFVLSSFVAAALAAFCWMLAIRTMSVSYAYPFMALSFVLVPAGAILFLGEKIGLMQAVGILLIVIGVVINAASQ